MASGLDMSLDDLIKNNKKSASSSAAAASAAAGRGRGGRAAAAVPGPGPARRLPNRSTNRTAPYAKPVQAPDSMWQHDMYSAYPAPGGKASSIETGTKLYISNLDYGVSNEDIKELFSEVGDLKRFAVHYDKSGRSKGSAEVVFSRKSDAVAALKRYNNVQLDGKPMKIDIVGSNIATPAPVPQVTKSILGNPNAIPKSGSGRGGPIGSARGGGGGRGRGRGGRGRGRGRNEPISAADLDADLDKYHTEAMQVN